MTSKHRKTTTDWLVIFHEIIVLHPSHPLCLQHPSRNPVLHSHKEPSKGHRLQSLSTGSRPQPSLAWKSISTAHPLVLPEEQFKQTLNEPMLTLRMCLKFEVSCKSGRLTQCHLTISQFTSNQWQWPGTQKNQWMLGLLPILHCWHKPQTTGNDFVDRWNRNKPNTTQQSC